MKPVTATPATAITLTPAEQRIVRDLRAMNDYSQNRMADLAKRFAAERPRHAAPALRLIAGGAA